MHPAWSKPLQVIIQLVKYKNSSQNINYLPKKCIQNIYFSWVSLKCVSYMLSQMIFRTNRINFQQDKTAHLYACTAHWGPWAPGGAAENAYGQWHHGTMAIALAITRHHISSGRNWHSLVLQVLISFDLCTVTDKLRPEKSSSPKSNIKCKQLQLNLAEPCWRSTVFLLSYYLVACELQIPIEMD
jgi:hypothetical protein